MKFSLAMALTFVTLISLAQQLPKRVLGSFVYKNSAFNYEFTKEDEGTFTFRVSSLKPLASKPLKLEKNSINDRPDSLSIDSTSIETLDTLRAKSDTIEYVFSEFSREVFQKAFLQQMIHTWKVEATQNDQLKQKALELFYVIKARLDFEEDEPVTAYLILRKDIIYSYLKYNASPFYTTGGLSGWNAKHYIKNVQIETEDGTIKNVIVKAVEPTSSQIATQSPRRYIEFKNQYPISISGKFDPEKFASIKLYCFDCNGIKGLSRFIKLADLMIFDIVLENDKEDYSPANSKILLSPSKPTQELKKEKRSRILEIAAFTDFAGLDQTEPNGLIQIEAKRKITINTKSHLLAGDQREDLVDLINFSNIKKTYAPQITYKKHRKTPKFTTYSFRVKKQPDPRDTTTTIQTIEIWNRKFRSPYYTLFNSIEPKLLFSKLEENNRILDSTGRSKEGFSPLALYQYQVVSLGANLNIFKLNFPQLKFNWNVISVGGYFFRTRIGNPSDTTSTSSLPLNSSTFVINSNIAFKPDNRWGITIGCDLIRTNLWSDDFKMTSRHPLIQPYAEAFLKTGDTNKLFFRFRWIYEWKNRTENFNQIQLGYSMNLFTIPPKATKS